MAQLTTQALRALLIEVAGEDDGLDPSADITDLTFEELGYDSLALMELSARIGREYGVEIDDDRLADLTTPRSLLDLVNGSPAEAP
ncbi:acyl carrier protein [Actinosynnema sp. NPDC051121]